jgi:hypothetical protein
MKKLIIQRSYKGPSVNFDPDTGLLEIQGQSILENPKNFYEPILENWLEKYIANPNMQTTVNIQLEYFNTSSAMWIFQILKKISELNRKKCNLEINWYYFDEDMLEIGEDYQAVISVPFNMIEVKVQEFEKN